MRTTEFVNELKRTGIGLRKRRGEDIISSYAWYAPSAFSARHLKDRGADIQALVTRLAGAPDAARTVALLSQPLPHAKSVVERDRVVCTAFDRFAIYRRGSQSEHELVVAHLAVTFECSLNFDPFFVTPTSSCCLTIRLLDLHLSESRDLPAALDVIPEVLEHLVMEHLSAGPVSAIRNNEQEDDSVYGVPLRIAIERNPRTHRHTETRIVRQVAVRLREAFDPDNVESSEAAEVFELATPQAIAIVDGGDAFDHAYDIARLGRKAFEKPPRQRPSPNELHCLLLRNDPVLYLKDGRVINPLRLALMQANATVPIDHEPGTPFDWEAIDERNLVYDRRLQTIRDDAAADPAIPTPSAPSQAVSETRASALT